MSNERKNDENFMLKLATFIVDKRNLIFLVVVIGLIFSAVSRNWISVENKLSAFLPEESETNLALELMDDEFTTFGTARIMISSISYEDAEEVHEMLEGIKGVQSADFDDTTDHYKNVSALYEITFDYDEDDDKCLDALQEVEDAVSKYDYYVVTELGDPTAEIIDHEISIIMVYVAVVVVTVLVFTSQTYAEVIVLLLTFVTAMILNMGTSFLLGTISFVSNSVTSILQLALSLDYAVILCNRFREEHESLPLREAVIVALSKAIPEISASSLTTIGGLVAMLFMQFKIGPDMAVNLIKSIFYALLSTFLLMPGLLVLFGPLMDKTKHKNFIPKIPFVGKFCYKTRHIIPAVFVVVMAGAFWASQNTPYVYGYDTLTTPLLNDTQIAENMIEDTFGSANYVALVVPHGDYEKEKKMITELESREEVDYCVGLANTEALGGYCLEDKLTPRQFAELANLDYEVAEVVYAAYAVNDENYGRIIGGISSYSVPLIDMFSFAYEEIQDGYVTLDADTMKTLEDAYIQMSNGRLQLEGENYDRILVYLNLPEGGSETYSFLDKIHEIAETYYDDDDDIVYVAGNSSSEYDFQKSFERDNIIVTVLSILIVLVVLLFTFNSVGMPILLIAVIEGAIWLNFGYPTIVNANEFFMTYLVVSSIQMGANIDYAIVISSRFNELKDKMDKKEAMIETLNFAFPTIVTSGSILAISGFLIGNLTSEPCICGIGQAIGRGTIISIILVLFVLPQILLIGERLIDRTSFSVPNAALNLQNSGRTRIDGAVHGEIHGTVTGVVHIIVDGDVNVNLISGKGSGKNTEQKYLPENVIIDGEVSETEDGEEAQDEA